MRQCVLVSVRQCSCACMFVNVHVSGCVILSASVNVSVLGRKYDHDSHVDQ